MVCGSVTKVASETETVYSPSGTASKWNSPPEFVCVLCVNSELRALRITVMPGTGRCCGSCTMPRTLPKIVAKAPAVANRKTGRTPIRRIFLLQRPNGLVRGQNVRGASEWNEVAGRAAAQAARAKIRGGGERGLIRATVFRDPGRGASSAKSIVVVTVKGAGSRKTTGVTAGRSGW